MSTLSRPLAAVIGCGSGAGIFLLIHGRLTAGLLIGTALFVGGLLTFIFMALARQNAYNRRAASDFRHVLVADAAHHARSDSTDPADDAEQGVSR